MFTCKDCVHYEVCKEIENMPLRRSFVWYSFHSGCPHFKNKADFVEVKHGEWEKYRVTEGHVYVCSLCGYRTMVDFEGEFLHHNYCTKCGADMRKEGADNGWIH